jgi:hypothetical protein
MTPFTVGPLSCDTISRCEVPLRDSESVFLAQGTVRLSLSCDAVWATQARTVLYCLRNALPLDF